MNDAAKYEHIDRTARTVLTAALCAFLIGVTAFLMGSAVAQPPTQLRGFEFSAATTVVPNGTDVTADLRSPGLAGTASLLLISDEAGGGTDIIVSLSGVNAAAPASTAASTSFRLKPGNMINIDGRWTQAILRGATATGSCRLIASY